MNWYDEDVLRAFEDYRQKRIVSLDQLRTAIHDITGFWMSIKTLSVRLRGLCKQNTRGRPKKPTSVMPREGAASARDIFGMSVEPARVRRISRVNDATPTSSNALIPQPKHSKFLNDSLRTVDVGDGFVRQYRRVNTSKDGTVEYCRCSKCDRLNMTRPVKFHPKLTIRLGKIVGDDQQPHHPDCEPIRTTKALATDIDRACRKEIRNGNCAPLDVYSKGYIDALNLANNLGWSTRGPNSIPTLYPTWTSVRKQYSEHRHYQAAQSSVQNP